MGIRNEIVSYLKAVQKEYMKNLDPKYLVALNQDDIADYLGLRDASSVSRNLKTIVLTHPDGKRMIPATDLVPGEGIYRIRAYEILDELSKDPTYYSEGKWVSSSMLFPVFKDRKLRTSKRGIRKYKQSWNESHPYPSKDANLDVGSEATGQTVHL